MVLDGLPTSFWCNHRAFERIPTMVKVDHAVLLSLQQEDEGSLYQYIYSYVRLLIFFCSILMH